MANPTLITYNKIMQLTKYEHACLLIRDGQNGLIIDPGKYTNLPDELENIGTVIVSDEHLDHLDVDNLKKILGRNPEAKIFSTKTVTAELAKEGITCTAVAGQLTTNSSGFEVNLIEVDHAVVYGNSPCRVLTVGIGNLLYYASDSFVSSAGQYLILAVPTSGPWFNLIEAIDLAKSIDSKYLIATHDIFLNEIGNASTHRFISLHVGEEKEFIYLQPNQSKDFDLTSS